MIDQTIQDVAKSVETEIGDSIYFQASLKKLKKPSYPQSLPSPYNVDELEAKDVWALATDKEGISHSKRLSDHSDAKRALELLTTGEFLGAEGEEWVIGEPAVEAQLHG